MMYCEHCDVELFGGSRCHICGGLLVPKVEEGPKVVHISSDAIMGRKKSLRSDTAQSLAGRLFRLTVEIALFCVIFYFVTLLIAHTINWISAEMAYEPAEEPDVIDVSSNAFKYFHYIGLVVVTLLTIRFRFQLGK